MSAKWIHSYFIWPVGSYLTWSEMGIGTAVWDCRSALVLHGCSAVWMGEFARFHSECTTLTFNISWKCCTSTVLFERSESLNKVFNSCIDFSTTVKTSQSYFFGVWLFSSAALGLVDIIVLPDAEPRVLSAFVSPKTVMSQLQILMDITG